MSATKSALLRTFTGVHSKCRSVDQPYGGSNVVRFPVPDAQVAWSTPFPGYTPIIHSDKSLESAPWADKAIADGDFVWQTIDKGIDRRSFLGVYSLDDRKRPVNPIGRTGIQERGRLGKWGPNHAADPIVTRWKRDDSNAIVKHPESGKPILQFVAILRGDTKEWAIPGGMVDAGEAVSVTLKREFAEEAFDGTKMTATERSTTDAMISEFFKDEHGVLVYKGYVDDPRNTDNAWMETVAVNFHDESGDKVGKFDLKAGDDAIGVHWTDISSSLSLYASHSMFVQAVARHRSAHW